MLDAIGIGSGPVVATRIGEGSSNATFEIRRGGERLVLRRPPRPPFPPSTHDVVREARLQIALHTLGVKTPEILVVHEDTALLGVPFYLMGYVEGSPLTDRLPPALVGDVAARGSLMHAVVAALVEIHAVDAKDTLLAEFYREGDYLKRQLRRFARLWEQSATREIQAVNDVRDWLSSTKPRPLPATVIHGDYRMGNILVGHDPRTPVAAIVDWEMGAIGDPRADLGYFVATYSDPAREPGPLELTPATRHPGFPTRAELVELYRQESGCDVSEIGWFEVLALWKTTILLEAIYARYLDGEVDAAGLAPRLDVGVPNMAHMTQHAAGAIERGVPWS